MWVNNESNIMVYQQWLNALDAEVLRHIERYANPLPGERLGYLYDSTLAEELAPFYAADGATDDCLGDFDMGDARDAWDERKSRSESIKNMLVGKPRGTWARLIQSYHSGTTTRFAMATGGPVFYKGDGDGFTSYELCRSRLIAHELYHARQRCNEVIAEREDARHADRWSVGSVLKNLTIGPASYSTLTVATVEPRQITLKAVKRGSPKRWLVRVAPRGLAKAVEEAATKVA